MKKIFIAASALMIFSCTSNDKNTTEETNNNVGVQNTTGTLPDTTNSINLSTQKKDTTMNAKDSTR